MPCSSTTRLSSAPESPDLHDVTPRGSRGSAHPRLVAAKARLDRLDWWPTPVRIEDVRLCTAPWFFRLPRLRRFDGFASHRLILLRSDDVSDDLVTHELCHVWQMQHRPIRMPLSYLGTGYASNQYERQARAAATVTGSANTQRDPVS